jgi:hypothetical protein
MTRPLWLGALMLSLMAGGRGWGGEPECRAPAGPGFLERWQPAGGWHPYGGGLLCWWDRHCFPRCGFPDDYDRKQLPRMCWPASPCCGLPLAASPQVQPGPGGQDGESSPGTKPPAGNTTPPEGQDPLGLPSPGR